MNVEEIRRLPHYRIPVVGQDVCVPTSLYIDRGEDDFQGGWCKIAKVIKKPKTKNEFNALYVVVEERPGVRYNWYSLMRSERDCKATYGDRRGYQDPDYTPSGPFALPDGYWYSKTTTTRYR